ncbi:MAG: hypothetical protein ACJAS4_000213 [Bacteriovoracaceae bacterium]|jgi:hypothetical protein
MIKIYSTLLFFLVAFNTQASFLPINKMEIPSINKENDNRLRETYQPIVNELLNLYESTVLSQNAKLIFQFDFSSQTVNAFAKRSGNNNELWHITFLGGLMRHPNLTRNIFAAVLCHELGHHLGGLPKKNPNHWASVEGQSDYFAANECLKKMLNDGTTLSPSINNIKPVIKKNCQLNFKAPSEYKQCLRSAVISEEIGYFIHKMKQSRRGQRGKKPSIESRDNAVASRTLIQHPNAQCRLDTFFEGSLCSDYYRSNGKQNPNCLDSDLLYEGSRPKCWYSPLKE